MSEPVLEQVTFRRASHDDIPFLLELRRRTMSAHLLASGIVASERERTERVLANFDCAWIILQADRPVGLLKVAKHQQPWVLHQIQLIPEMQGRGLGAALIRDLITEAMLAGASLELSVLRANPARQLYERLGFRVIGEDEHVYDMRCDPG